ncbi:hypothetical protein EMPG_15895, partial [Blastomyces silverae]
TAEVPVPHDCCQKKIYQVVDHEASVVDISMEGRSCSAQEENRSSIQAESIDIQIQLKA